MTVGMCFIIGFIVAYYIFVFIAIMADEYEYKRDLLIDICIPFGFIPRIVIRKLRDLR